MGQRNRNQGRDQFVINDPQQVNIHSSAEEKRHPALEKLLDAVEREVQERLAQSLHRSVNADLINVGKQLEPHQVTCPSRRMELTVCDAASQSLPSGTTIVDVFQNPEVKGKLLILGEPGAGKTTTLLELASALVQRASADATEPVPILLNLSTWKEPQQPIFEWLLAELKSKYGLRQELGRQWLEADLLIPFLDGLDEVATERQELCAKALNAWLEGNLTERPVKVTVCCRRREYEEVVRQHLYLQNSVGLQPLQDVQIADYLAQFGIAEVWQSVQTGLWTKEWIPHLSVPFQNLTERTSKTRDRKSTRLNSSHVSQSRMPSSA